MLTDLQRKKLPNLFHLHDVDDDGLLQKSDFDTVAHQMAQARGLAADSSEAVEVRARFTAAWDSMSAMAGDGRITLEGWLAFWDHAISTEGLYDQVVRPVGEFVFYLLDQDGSGNVTAEEYMTFARIMSMDPDHAAEVFPRLDGDGDGSLSRDEISVLLEQYFTSADPSAPGNWFFGPVA